MAESYQRRSALQHFGLTALAAHARPEAAEILLGERAHRAIVNLRGDGSDPAFLSAIRSVAGLDLPVKPNTSTSAGGLTMLWLGPTEWWIIGADGDQDKLCPAFAQAFQGQHAAIIDVSESRAVISVSGAKARDLLARGISLDLHPRVFQPGQCAQTGMTRANVLIHQTDSVPSYDLYVLKSFADYLWQWLHLAGRDFKLGVTAG
jgi:sarcosine oxidase, subunit gamma